MLAAEEHVGSSTNVPPAISVVVPVLNERESIEELQAALVRTIEGSGQPFEVLWIDDGSTDGSGEVLKRIARGDPRARVFHCRKNFGKSVALDVGFRNARGRRIVTIDSDLQDDPEEIPSLLAKLDEGFDLVSGWKADRQDPLAKTVSSRLFNAATRVVSGLKLHDFNCGLKAYRRELIECISLYGEMHRYIPALAHWKGFRVAEIPVRHRPRRHGVSKFGAERYLRGLFDLMTVAFLTKYAGRPMHFFGKPGLAMSLVGLAISLHMLVLKLRGEYLSFRPLLTLGVLLLILGMVILSTGFLGELIVYLFRVRDLRIPPHVIREIDETTGPDNA